MKRYAEKNFWAIVLVQKMFTQIFKRKLRGQKQSNLWYDTPHKQFSVKFLTCRDRLIKVWKQGRDVKTQEDYLTSTA